MNLATYHLSYLLLEIRWAVERPRLKNTPAKTVSIITTARIVSRKHQPQALRLPDPS